MSLLSYRWLGKDEEERLKMNTVLQLWNAFMPAVILISIVTTVNSRITRRLQW